ncbi:hypothetical protein Tco_0060486 [Tanacetum coccineum]
MFLNVDQLGKQLDKEEFQEIGSMAAFKVLETQFEMFIKSRMYMDDEYVVMTRNYILQYTQLEILEFRDTLIQHMESTTKDKVDSSKALDASLVDTESSGTTLKEQDTSNRSGNDAHVDDADIRPIYYEEPMAENAEQCHDTCPLPATLIDNETTELSNQSLEYENIRLKKTVAQFQKDFLRIEAHCVNLELKYQNQALKEGQDGQFLKVTSNEAKVKHDIDVIETINIELEHKLAKLLMENETLKKHYKEMFDSIKTTRAKNIEHTTSLIANNDKFKAQLQEKGFAIAALKNELRKLTGNSVNTKFAKSSILGKSALQPRRNQSVVRQPTTFKSERPRISKQRFASQVDENNDLSKPVTTHYLPKEKESAVAKPHHMIAPGSSRYSSNDMVHKHYLEEAKKKTQESSRNSEPSVMPSARSQSTTNGSKPTPRINNQKSRNWPASKSSCVTTKTVPIAEHSRNSRSFSDSNKDCVTTKTVLNMSEMWKPTGKIFKTVGLRWVPTRKIFTSSTTKVNSEPQNGSNDDITNQYECEQTLDVSAMGIQKKCMDKGEKKEEPTTQLRQKPESNTYMSKSTKMLIADIEDDIIGLQGCNAKTTFPAIQVFLKQKLVSFVRRIQTTSTDFSHVLHKLLTRVLRIILVIVPEHPSDTYVLTMKMEILLEPASNKLLVGDSLNLPDHRIHKDGDGDALF